MVAAVIVEGFEIVQIDKQQCPQGIFALAGGNGVFQPILQQAAVGQLGERVKKRQVVNARFVFLALGNVGERGNVVGNLLTAIFYRGDGEPLGVNFPAAAAVPDLPFPTAFVDDGVPDIGVELGFVVPGIEQARVLPNHLFRAVAGDLTEGFIDAQNHPVRVGNHHALARFKGGGGHA